MLSAKQNNWLASVLINSYSKKENITWSLAKVDVSTGELIVQEGQEINNLRQELIKLEAAEIISEKETIKNQHWRTKAMKITEFNQTSFTELESKTAIINHYSLSNIDGLGLHSHSLSIRAIGGLIAYLNKTHPNLKNHDKHTIKTHIALDLSLIHI